MLIPQESHQVVGMITASKIHTKDGMRERVALIVGNDEVTPSPESTTVPVVRPEAYRDSVAWMAMYRAGVLKVSNMIWVILSLLALGPWQASVKSTG